VFLLDDFENRQNWETLIVEEGGDYKSSTADLLKTEIVERPAGEEPDPLQDITDAGLHTVNGSHTDNALDSDTTEQAYRVIAKEPRLRDRFSLTEIADLIAQGIINVPDVQEALPSTGVVDMGAECREYSDKLEQLTKDYANRVAPYGTDRAAWVTAKKDISNAAKRAGNFRQEPSKETDPERLRIAVEYVKRRVGNLSNRGQT
jgi:hypothetical protein